MVKWLVVIGVLLVGAWLAVGWVMADRFLTLGIVDFDAAEERRILRDLGITDLRSESVEIVVGEVTLAATLIRHPEPQQCGVVLLPGIGGTRTQVLPAIPFFWDMGCDLIAYDPRGTGASTRVVRTFGQLEKIDNAAVVRWLAATVGVSESDIGIWGPSFGAAVGLLTLDEIPNLRFVIADSTFSTFESVAFESIALLSNTWVANAFAPLVLKILEVRIGLDMEQISPSRTIAGSVAPVLLIHAKDDPAMALHHSQIVHAARPSNKVQLVVTDWGAGHADSGLIDPVAYKQHIDNFLLSH